MDSRTPKYLFNFLATFGLFLLSVTLITASLSRKIQRSKTWYSMIISWIVYAASYMLILGHQEGPDPPRGICTLQMMLIYASPSLAATTGLAFILDVHLRLTKALFNKVEHGHTQSFLIIPWTIFMGVCAEALINVQDFSQVQRDPNHMYCHSVTDTQARITAVICVIVLSIALSLIVWTSIILYRNWRPFRRINHSATDLRLSSLIRILVFTLQTSIGLGLGAFATPANVIEGVAIWSALLPILPVLCGFAFGTQQDIVHCVIFCGRRRNMDKRGIETKVGHHEFKTRV